MKYRSQPLPAISTVAAIFQAAADWPPSRRAAAAGVWNGVGWGMRISVIGLGKLGAPLVAVLASKGFEVVGVDRSPTRVSALRVGRAPVVEPGLQDLLAGSLGRIDATIDIQSAIATSEVTFVVVPTPTGSDGSFSTAHVISAIREIGGTLRGKVGYHLVVITSTVMPGSTGGPVRQAL